MKSAALNWSISLLDALFALIAVLLCLINPPTKAKDSVPPGAMAVEVRWGDEQDCDLDVWAKAPGDRPVGYSAPSGAIFNLLRDDLGNVNDTSGRNYETAFTRGLPAGEYAINLHLYTRRPDCTLPLAADVDVKVRRGNALFHILSKRVTLSQVGEEITVARFTLDKNGALVPGSLHDIPIKLREAR